MDVIMVFSDQKCTLPHLTHYRNRKSAKSTRSIPHPSDFQSVSNTDGVQCATLTLKKKWHVRARIPRIGIRIPKIGNWIIIKWQVRARIPRIGIRILKIGNWIIIKWQVQARIPRIGNRSATFVICWYTWANQRDDLSPARGRRGESILGFCKVNCTAIDTWQSLSAMRYQSSHYLLWGN